MPKVTRQTIDHPTLPCPDFYKEHLTNHTSNPLKTGCELFGVEYDQLKKILDAFLHEVYERTMVHTMDFSTLEFSEEFLVYVLVPHVINRYGLSSLELSKELTPTTFDILREHSTLHVKDCSRFVPQFYSRFRYQRYDISYRKHILNEDIKQITEGYIQSSDELQSIIKLMQEYDIEEFITTHESNNYEIIKSFDPTTLGLQPWSLPIVNHHVINPLSSTRKSYYTYRIVDEPNKNTALQNRLEQSYRYIQNQDYSNISLDFVTDYNRFQMTKWFKGHLTLRNFPLTADDLRDIVIPFVSSRKDITKLTLTNCSISELPDEISKLTNLTELWLGDNKLSTLPSSITKLQNLETLSISQNNFTDFPMTVLWLKNLTAFWYNGNSYPIRPHSFEGKRDAIIHRMQLIHYFNKLHTLLNIEMGYQAFPKRALHIILENLIGDFSDKLCPIWFRFPARFKCRIDYYYGDGLKFMPINDYGKPAPEDFDSTVNTADFKEFVDNLLFKYCQNEESLEKTTNSLFNEYPSDPDLIAAIAQSKAIWKPEKSEFHPWEDKIRLITTLLRSNQVPTDKQSEILKRLSETQTLTKDIQEQITDEVRAARRKQRLKT